MNSIYLSATFFNIASSLLAVLLLAAAPSTSYAVVIDKISVIVNADVITESEIRAIQQLGLNLSGLPAETDPVLQRINHHLVLQQIEKQPPLSIDNDRLQETIAKYSQKYGGSEELLLYLHSIGMNYQDFDSELREQLSINAFVNLRFRPFVNVTIEEAERYYNEVYKTEYEVNNQEAPSFALSFDEIQSRLAQQQVVQRTRDWLEEIRKTSTINRKD